MTWTNSPYLKAVDERVEKAIARDGVINAINTIRATVRDVPASDSFRFIFGITEDLLPQIERLCADVPALSARVKELEAALERVLRFADELCEDVGVSKHYYSAEMARAVLATPPPEGDAPCAP